LGGKGGYYFPFNMYPTKKTLISLVSLFSGVKYFSGFSEFFMIAFFTDQIKNPQITPISIVAIRIKIKYLSPAIMIQPRGYFDSLLFSLVLLLFRFVLHL
jgi:hypothetical protein